MKQPVPDTIKGVSVRFFANPELGRGATETEEMCQRTIGVLEWLRDKRPPIVLMADRQNKDPHCVQMRAMGRALKAVMPMIQNNRQWFSIYRVLVDRKRIPNEGYVSFVNLIQDLLGEDAPNLSVDDLRRMSVMCFADPFVMWTPENAPIGEKRFYDYLNIARAFNRALR